MAKYEYSLQYTKPADRWCQGMPLGNGRLGAMILGGIEQDTVYLNEDTLWSGLPYTSSRTDSYKIFSRARELVLAGKKQEACRLLESQFGDTVTQMYLPLGHIVLTQSGITDAREYSRRLDMETGTACISFTAGNTVYERSAFVSYADDVVVLSLTANKPGSITCRLDLDSLLHHTTIAENDTVSIEGNCPVYPFPWGTGERKDAEKYEYGDTDEKKGIGFYGRMQVIPTGGSVARDGDAISVTNADSVLVLFGARTSFAGWDKHPVLEGRPYREPCMEELTGAGQKSWKELYRSHMQAFGELFHRVSLTLPEDENASLPTDERLIRHGNGEKDRGLYALLFHYGRYLTISSSRPGSQVTNLQGLWSDQLLPAWGCNCTININTEMNYWPTLMCGLFECYEPLVRMVEELSVSGEPVAKMFYDAPGFVSHSATDLWRRAFPHSNGISGSTQWGFWYMSAGWLCRMLWDYYAFTADETYLRRIWPVLLKAGSFYRSLLTERDGELILTPCTSPENNYMEDGQPCPIDVTTEMSMAITRDLFRCIADAGKVLGETDGEEYAKLLPRLRKIHIGTDGRILEWYTDHPDWDEHHRHTSHLYGLYPGREISPETPELMRAAEKVLNVRGDKSTGWSTAWKVNFWARLKDGNRAEKLLDMQLMPVAGTESISEGGGSFLSLLCAHPPFQIDGNFGGAAGVGEMLLRTEGDRAELLPALPDDWDEGEVTGLRLHRGGKISFGWKHGKVTWCRITGGVDYAVTSRGEPIAYTKCLVLQSGRPAETRENREERCYKLLEQLGISYHRMDHESAYTMEACADIEKKLGAPIVKNLVLTNRQRTQFYLLLMPGDKPFLTKELSKQIGSARLSFASEEDLLRLLDVYPGSASILGLANDGAGAVRLLADGDLKTYDSIGCHPCRNTTTLAISAGDVWNTLVPALHHPVQWVTLTGEA